MSSDAITCGNLAKTYLIYPTPAARLKQMLWRGKRRFYTPFEALKPVSFTLKKGETVGIVGRNGSGKSTLLQLIAGTLTPSAGSVSTTGKTAALLELGAGFNPEFSGRENLYLNGAILGMSRIQMDSLYREITDFAAIGEFIDRPVATYSSGMVVRLAFAVATAIQPEILIVDEALSVGDEAFQRKCFARIEQMRANGTTILFVSHSAQAVIQLCDRALWLDQGALKMDGTPKEVLDAYHKSLNQDSRTGERKSEEKTEILRFSETVQEYPAQGGRILNPRLTDETGGEVSGLEHERRYRFTYEVQLDKAAANLRCGMLIKTRTGVEAAGAVMHLAEHGMPGAQPGTALTVAFSFTCLLYPGQYYLNCGVMGEVDGEERYLHRLVDAFLLPVIHPARRNKGGVAAEGLVDLEFSAEVR